MKLRKVPLLACLIFSLFVTVSTAQFIDFTSGVKVVYDQVEVNGSLVTRSTATTSETAPNGVIEVREQQTFIVPDGIGFTLVVTQGLTLAIPDPFNPGFYFKQVTTETITIPVDSSGNPIGPPDSMTEVVTEADVAEADLDLPSSTNITPPDGELDTPDVISPP